MTKICAKCKRSLDKSYFTKYKASKDGLQSWCKDCMHEYDKNRNKNKDRQDYCKAVTKKYNEDNLEHNREVQKEYRKRNIDKIREYNKQYRIEHINEIRVKDRIRDASPSRKISRIVHKSLNKNRCETSKHFEDILGYTTDKLKKHLESQFTVDMTWDNYSRYGWHIDHIIPQCLLPFNSTDDNNFKICWSLYNLRPLWDKDNLSRPKDGSDIDDFTAIYIISKALGVDEKQAKIKWNSIRVVK